MVLIKEIKKTHAIWIADDVVIECNSKIKFWQKFFIKLFLGWKYEKIKKGGQDDFTRFA